MLEPSQLAGSGQTLVPSISLWQTSSVPTFTSISDGVLSQKMQFLMSDAGLVAELKKSPPALGAVLPLTVQLTISSMPEPTSASIAPPGSSA